MLFVVATLQRRLPLFILRCMVRPLTRFATRACSGKLGASRRPACPLGESNGSLRPRLLCFRWRQRRLL
jgi:hypothetical protein